MPFLQLAAVVTVAAISTVVIELKMSEFIGTLPEPVKTGSFWLLVVAAVVSVSGSAFFLLTGVVKLTKFIWDA
jgi:hypothetical protein